LGSKTGRTGLLKSSRCILEPKKIAEAPRRPDPIGGTGSTRQLATDTLAPRVSERDRRSAFFMTMRPTPVFRFHCAVGSRGGTRRPMATRRRLRRHECAPVELSLLPLKGPLTSPRRLTSPRCLTSPRRPAFPLPRVSHRLVRQRCRAKVAMEAVASSGRRTSLRPRHMFSRRMQSLSHRCGTSRTG
jgi:hypothetical protein